MVTVVDPFTLRHHGNPLQLPRSRLTDERTTPTFTTLPSAMKHPHAASLVSPAPDVTPQTLNPEKNYHLFSKTLLKNKSLLVPRRLALQRQRGPMKGPMMVYGPVKFDLLQMELGNPEEYLMQWDSYDDDDEDDRQNTPRLNVSLEKKQTELLSSHHPSSMRVNTPHTAPTDISLLYKEKPISSHPITGQVLHGYIEDTGGPSPCSYVLPRKSCREKNAPAFTFGSRCLVEKKGGSRTAWEKQWFAHSNPFTTKVDFNRERAWPTPVDYPPVTTFGVQPTKVSFPSWSIATRLQPDPTFIQDTGPSPNTYDAIDAFRKLTAKTTHITLKSRPGGTQLSTKSSTSIVPGPGAHDQTKFLSNKYSFPKFSFGKRLPTSLAQDPYVNTLPPIEY